MRLLLADDNEMNVEFFTAALDQYDVTVARDGQTALEAGLREPFDVILLDIQMPRLDGNQVCSALRSAGIRVPILALTASAMPHEVVRGRAAGFDDYITKPISPAALREAIAQHVGNNAA
jgi:hypothetical protein